MKLAAKKLAAIMLVAVMIGTIPGVDVFAESIQSASSTSDAYYSTSSDSSDAAGTEDAAGSFVTDGTDNMDSAGNTGAVPDSKEKTVSSSSFAEKKESFDATASGFADDRYQMTAESITGKDVLSEIEKLMDGREIVTPLEISVTEGTVADAQKGIEVTLHGLDLADTDGVGLYHIAGFETDSPKIEKLDYSADANAKAVTFTTKSFSPFVFAKMTDEEIRAEKDKQPKEANDENRTGVTEGSAASAAKDVAGQTAQSVTVTPSPVTKAKSQQKMARAAANTLHVTDLSLSADLSSGANTSTYVWTPSSDESDHAYIYRIGYTTSGTGSFAPGQFSIILPKRLLKDRDGKYADSYDMSVPNESEEGLSDDNTLVYKEDGSNIVVYNRLEIPAAQKGYIEVAYRTSKRTWEYADYAADGSGMNGKNPCSDTFNATFTAGTKTAKASAPAVFMDTHAEVTGTEKQSPLTLYEDWNTSWGNAPSNAENYYYLVWNIRTYIDANQPYTYTVTDSFSDYGDIVGVKYAEESTFTDPHSIMLKQNFKKQYRTDTVITRIAKATYASKDSWTVKNTETVTVHPADGVDADSKASSSKTYSYEIPHFVRPVGHFDAEKYGLDYKKERVKDSGSLCLVDDTVSSFVDGSSKTLGTFPYAAVVSGFPYPWTLEESADPTNPDNYGKIPVTYSITDDTLKLYDETADQTVGLGGDDYTISGMSIKYQCKDADYNTTTCKFDKKEGNKENDVVHVYIKKKGSTEYTAAGDYAAGTGTWSNLDSSVKAYGTTLRFSEDVIGYKVETSNAHYYTNLTVYPEITLKDSTTVKSYAGSHSNLITLKNYSVANVMQNDGTEIGAFDCEGTAYAGMQQRQGLISKVYDSYSNDRVGKMVSVKWHVTASEKNKTTNNNVQQKSGTFYDLLPKGATYKEGSAVVYADGEKLADGVYTVSVTDNYKDSGQTLLTVKIGKAANQYDLYYESQHSHDVIKDSGRTFVNVAAYETGNDKIGGGSPDNGGNLAEKSIMADLDPDTDAAKFLYIKTAKTLSIPVSANLGLYKQVKSENDSRYSASTVTKQNGGYSYKLRFATDDVTTAKDLVLYDSLENFTTADGKTSDWHGILQSVDTSEAEKLGIAPVIYYSTAKDPDTAKFDGTLDPAIWSTEAPSNLSKITAVAVDCRKNKNGGSYILPKNTGVSVTLYMKAPASVIGTATDRTAYNNVYLHSTIIAEDKSEKTETIHQDYTQVTYRAMGNVSIHKVSSSDKSPVAGIGFTLSGTSDYGTAVHMVKTTNAKGEITFNDVESGIYTLQETGFLDDYLEDDTQYTVTIDNAGKAAIDGLTETSDGSFEIENTPRVHGSLYITKKGTQDNSKALISLTGAVFKLYGTSDYGNEVLMYAESNKGDLAFENIEKGTYSLVETKAPDGYILPKNTVYTVVCDDNGNVGIQGIKMDTNGRYVLTNEPYHVLTILKEADFDKTTLQGAEFDLKGTSDYGTEVDVTAVSGKNGLLSFARLEPGTYILMEKKAPEGYRADSTRRAVVIAKDGTTTIQGLTAVKGTFLAYNQKIPTDKVVVTKKWKDGLTGDAAKNRPYPNIHIASYNKDDKISIPVTTNWNGMESTGVTGITVTLKSGETLKSETLTTGSGWKTTFASLPKWDDAEQPISYSLSVKSLGEGYQTSVTGNAEDGFVVNITPEYAAYAVYSPGDKTLYFVQAQKKTYQATDTLTSKSGKNYSGTVYEGVETKSGYREKSKPEWLENAAGIKKVVVVDPVAPIDCHYWFYGCSNAVSMDLANLDTSKVTDMREMFSGCGSLASLDVSGFDTSNVTGMYNMFNGCGALTSLDVSNFNTSKVTGTNYMFFKCGSLAELNVSGFDMSKVTNTNSMFDGCAKLKTIYGNTDWSQYGGITKSKNMFRNCDALVGGESGTVKYSDANANDISMANPTFGYFTGTAAAARPAALTALQTAAKTISSMAGKAADALLGVMEVEAAGTDIASGTWGTCTWVIDSNGVMTFGPGTGTAITGGVSNNSDTTNRPWKNYCSQITKIQASGTVNLPSICQFMFYGCTNLTSVDMSKFNTKNVTYMSSMFQDCSNVETLDLSSFDTTNVKYMQSMFNGCSRLTKVDLSSFNTAKVQYMGDMFSGCSSLTDLDVSNFKTANVKYMQAMFKNCFALKEINVSGFDTTNVTNISTMFSGCAGLTELDLSNFKTSNVIYMNQMFYGCTNLTNLELQNFDTAKVQYMTEMFSGCTNLSKLNISSFDTSGITNAANMKKVFAGCTSLSELTLSPKFQFKTASLPSHAKTNIYTEKWTKTTPYNHTDAISTDVLQAKYGTGTGASPEAATWYWEMKGVDPYTQNGQSSSGVTKSTDADGKETETVNVYDPQTDGTEKLDTFVDANGDHTGYWTKLSDDTWTYTFYVTKTDVSWHVWEDKLDGYQSSNTASNPLIIKTGTDEAVITNYLESQAQDKVGSLTLTKNAVDSTGAAITPAESFRFAITLTKADGTALTGVNTYGDIAFNNGKAAVTMAAGQTITMTDIPEGTQYTITETDIPDGYKQTGFTGSSGKIVAEQTAAAVCINTKDTTEHPDDPDNPDTPKTGGFILTKSCPDDTETAFTFHVSMTGLAKNKTYTYGTSGSFTSDDSGMADVTLELKDGESAPFTGLPIDAAYQVTEDANAYAASFKVIDANGLGLVSTNRKENTKTQTSLSTAKETVDDGESITIAFTNTKMSFPVSIRKQDPEGNYVAGARLQIKQQDTVVHEWTTAEDKTETTGLTPGSYTLHEASAPSGYQTAEDIAFTVGNDGTIATDGPVSQITMVDEKSGVTAKIQKTDGKNALPGAVLQLLDDTGNVVDGWTTDGSGHAVTLSAGRTYTLHEKKAPKGYDYAGDIAIVVAGDGTIIVDGKETDVVTMVDKPLAQLPNSGAAGTPWWPFVAAVCGLTLAARPGKKKKKGPGDGTGKE